MKKVMMMAALVAALISCQSKGNSNNADLVGDGIMAIAENDSSAVLVYEGVLPATNGPGIEYVLAVDSISPNGESEYTMIATYLDADGPGKHKSFVSKGKKQVVEKQVNDKPKTAYKLTPDDGNEPLYFVVINDTTLRLSNGDLQEDMTVQGFDLVQVKK